MIDKWFKKDIEKVLKDKNIIVLIGESRKAQFLTRCLDTDIKEYVANDEIEELKVKYHIEKEAALNQKIIIYTHTPKDKLKFIREYCETDGNIEIKSIQNYIKQKIFENLKENINLSDQELLSAAKNSIGKDELYWRSLIAGTGGIFDLEKELLPFIHSPNTFIKRYDVDTKMEFYKKVNEYLHQQYVDKPATTLANEVVNYILDGLLTNKLDNLSKSVYTQWLDSKEYGNSFDEYLKKYKVDDSLDIWHVSPSHPFNDIDIKWLKEIGENINNSTKIINYLAKVNQRSQNQEAKKLGITFWKDIKILLEFDQQQISSISSVDECIDFYISKLYKIDQSIRALYTEFIDNESVLTSYQEYYKNLMSLFLDKWFTFLPEYRQNQTGKLKEIIESNDEKTAIIVGDGVTYEISQNIALLVSKAYTQEHDYILVDTPSITENNMSQIYVSSGEIFKALSDREKFLANELSNKNIGFVYLDKVDEDTQFDYLVCQYKDIDELGDKMNNKALKYFPDSEKYFAQKIEFLLNNGYKKVYLITDHGFVLTGHIKEHDKIEVSFDGKVKKAERYIRTVKQQENVNNLVEKAQVHGEYNYVYFSKSMNPFKTIGAYGFSHGGLAPQELITPYISWSNDQVDINNLKVIIANKDELSNVTGNFYQIKLETKGTSNDIFSHERKVIIMHFNKGKIISKSEIITLCHSDIIKKEFEFDGYNEIDIQILDAMTKELLDKTAVTKKNDRDLGGLL
ncbi:PglZ domain-containing protein [Sulfurimonas sp. SWIR-19]|uniref:PglZ domain-containing protein n=1 Tax=Sulfurimonas sp. SWIR-19 TaxID=2878390 RepID=UPI001CF35007|nr:PglZ domain-containing protein [Sulfurimonas sp. SWIR-19]UCN01378.1 PglZ domain-containing protein [Sulfurimonas sp. SWIR-19]